jgi:hypothetical protein
MLSKNKKKEENLLLKNQIEDYINFIEELTEITNIMSTYFYIIIPFYPIESKKDGFFEKISSSLNPKKVIYQQRESFETFRNQLYIRMEQIMDGLSGLGLKIAPLQTEELVELFYNFYNPSEFEYNEMENIEQIEIDE